MRKILVFCAALVLICEGRPLRERRQVNLDFLGSLLGSAGATDTAAHEATQVGDTQGTSVNIDFLNSFGEALGLENLGLITTVDENNHNPLAANTAGNTVNCVAGVCHSVTNSDGHNGGGDLGSQTSQGLDFSAISGFLGFDPSLQQTDGTHYNPLTGQQETVQATSILGISVEQSSGASAPGVNQFLGDASSSDNGISSILGFLVGDTPSDIGTTRAQAPQTSQPSATTPSALLGGLLDLGSLFQAQPATTQATDTTTYDYDNILYDLPPVQVAAASTTKSTTSTSTSTTKKASNGQSFAERLAASKAALQAFGVGG